MDQVLVSTPLAFGNTDGRMYKELRPDDRNIKCQAGRGIVVATTRLHRTSVKLNERVSNARVSKRPQRLYRDGTWVCDSDSSRPLDPAYAPALRGFLTMHALFLPP